MRVLIDVVLAAVVFLSVATFAASLGSIFGGVELAIYIVLAGAVIVWRARSRQSAAAR